jgi:hypothetical protein
MYIMNYCLYNIVDLLQDGALLELVIKIVNNFSCIFSSEFLILHELVRNDKAFIISLLYRFFYLLIVGLNWKIHGFHSLIDLIINLKLFILLYRQKDWHMGVDGNMCA